MTIRLFTGSALDELAAKAAASSRGRAHLNVHASPSDLVQRFFVVAMRETYIRPHRHHTKSELALVLRGGFDVVTFDDHGVVTGRYSIGTGSDNMGYESAAATWHTLIAHTNGSAFLEIKEGPYDPAVAAEFASWAPQEGDPAVPAFLTRLRHAQPGERMTG